MTTEIEVQPRVEGHSILQTPIYIGIGEPLDKAPSLEGQTQVASHEELHADAEMTAGIEESELVFARVDDDVVHRNGGQVVAQRQPAGATVERSEDAELGADKEQIGIARVLDDDPDRTELRQVGADVRPVGPVVAALDFDRMATLVMGLQQPIYSCRYCNPPY